MMHDHKVVRLTVNFRSPIGKTIGGLNKLQVKCDKRDKPNSYHLHPRTYQTIQRVFPKCPTPKLALEKLKKQMKTPSIQLHQASLVAKTVRKPAPNLCKL